MQAIMVILRSRTLAAKYGGSAVLIVAALIFGWNGASEWIANAALSDAVAFHEMGRAQEASDALDRALWWRSDADARLFKAKILLASGDLPGAEEIYKTIAAERRRDVRPHIGLGVAAAMFAETKAESQPDDAKAALHRARSSFANALKIDANCFEAAVGAACVSLLSARTLKISADPLAEFRDISVAFGDAPSKEGLIDHAVGSAAASAFARKDFPFALASARRAAALAPGRPEITTVLLNIEAIGLSRPDVDAATLAPDAGYYRETADRVFAILSRDGKKNRELADACRNFLYTLSWAYARAGNFRDAGDPIRRMSDAADQERYETLLLNGLILNAEADRRKPGGDRATLKMKAKDPLLKAAAQRKQAPEIANLVAAAIDEAAETNQKPALLAEAVVLLRRTAEATPGHYPTLRNLAILLKKTGQKEEAKTIGDRAAMATGKSGSTYGDDLARLKKYLESP